MVVPNSPITRSISVLSRLNLDGSAIVVFIVRRDRRMRRVTSVSRTLPPNGVCFVFVAGSPFPAKHSTNDFVFTKVFTTFRLSSSDLINFLSNVLPPIFAAKIRRWCVRAAVRDETIGTTSGPALRCSLWPAHRRELATQVNDLLLPPPARRPFLS